jgi:hypothetical protein
MDSTDQKLDECVQTVFREYTKTYYNHKKREATSNELSKHIADKTFPHYIKHMKLPRPQYPKTLSEGARAEAINESDKIIQDFQTAMLKHHYKFIEQDKSDLFQKIQSYQHDDTLESYFAKLVPIIRNPSYRDAQIWSKIKLSFKTQTSIFVADQVKRADGARNDMDVDQQPAAAEQPNQQGPAANEELFAKIKSLEETVKALNLQVKQLPNKQGSKAVGGHGSGHSNAGTRRHTKKDHEQRNSSHSHHRSRSSDNRRRSHSRQREQRGRDDRGYGNRGRSRSHSHSRTHDKRDDRKQRR